MKRGSKKLSKSSMETRDRASHNFENAYHRPCVKDRRCSGMEEHAASTNIRGKLMNVFSSLQTLGPVCGLDSIKRGFRWIMES